MTVESKVASGGSNALDLAFIVDCTGSMSSYIQSAQRSMHQIVESIVASEKADVQVAIVGYRDFTDQWTTKVYDFTDSLKEMKKNIDTLSAQGGGDAPEAITAGLWECNRLNFRKGSTRVAVLIGDAPDHGLGEPGDSYPNGDTQGRDPLAIANEMLEKGIVIYAVACEPSLSSSQYGRDFFMALARITQGRFLPLTSANLLPDVIIGGAKEEMSLQKMSEAVEQEAKTVVKEKAAARGVAEAAIAEDEVAAEVANRMQARGWQVNEVQVDDVYSGYNTANVEQLIQHKSLRHARVALKPNLNASAVPQSSFLSSARLSASAVGAPMAPMASAYAMPGDSPMVQHAWVNSSAVNAGHVSRVMKKSAASKH